MTTEGDSVSSAVQSLLATVHTPSSAEQLGSSEGLNRGTCSGQELPRSTELRFWAKIATGAGCWLWTGATDDKGYGAFYIRRRRTRATRLLWRLLHGFIPAGQHVLHRCDVPRCMNPAHLFLGTNADNVADKVAKGRQVRGSAMHSAVLTEAKVREIRSRLSRGERQASLAREYGVSATQMNAIALGRKWKHVTGDTP